MAKGGIVNDLWRLLWAAKLVWRLSQTTWCTHRPTCSRQLTGWGLPHHQAPLDVCNFSIAHVTTLVSAMSLSSGTGLWKTNTENKVEQLMMLTPNDTAYDHSCEAFENQITDHRDWGFLWLLTDTQKGCDQGACESMRSCSLNQNISILNRANRGWRLFKDYILVQAEVFICDPPYN